MIHKKGELELNEEEAAFLAILGRSLHAPGTEAENAKTAIDHLVHSAADGVRRPGSWERVWLASAFPEHVWEVEVEQDPAVSYCVRPKKRVS